MNRFGGDRHGDAIAGLARDVVRAFLGQPFSMRNEAGERVGKLRDQRLPCFGGQIFAKKQRLAHGGKVAVPLGNAIENRLPSIPHPILDQREAGSGRPNLGNGGGERTRERRARSNRALHALNRTRDEVD